MTKNTASSSDEDRARYKAIAEAMLASIPDRTMWHDVFQATLLLVDTIDANAEKSGAFRHFMASALRRRAVHLTNVGFLQAQPGDKGPSASGARCSELTDQFLDLTEGKQVSEVIGAALNVIDIATEYITPADRLTVAAKMHENAKAIEGDIRAANVAPGATPTRH